MSLKYMQDPPPTLHGYLYVYFYRLCGVTPPGVGGRAEVGTFNLLCTAKIREKGGGGQIKEVGSNLTIVS
jgi:hypothetical protein